MIRKETAAWLFAAFCTLALLLLSPSVCRADLNRCLAYWPSVIREARYHIGMAAPARDFMGQIENESRCIPGITSEEGSEGLGQFMPDTAKWIQLREIDLQKISPSPQPHDPNWAIPAIILFDRYLFSQVHCQKDWYFAFRAYNGGLDSINREIFRARTCKHQAVESQCHRKTIQTKNGTLNLCQVNINYPSRLHVLGQKYKGVSVQ